MDGWKDVRKWKKRKWAGKSDSYASMVHGLLTVVVVVERKSRRRHRYWKIPPAKKKVMNTQDSASLLDSRVSPPHAHAHYWNRRRRPLDALASPAIRYKCAIHKCEGDTYPSWLYYIHVLDAICYGLYQRDQQPDYGLWMSQSDPQKSDQNKGQVGRSCSTTVQCAPNVYAHYDCLYSP
jgi:hypothetical protein